MPNRDFPPLKAWSVAKRTLGLDGAAMKTIQIEAFGNPAEVVRAVDVPNPSAPAAGGVVIGIEIAVNRP